MQNHFEDLFKPFFQLKLQMYLYSINLKEPSTITHMECGQFLQEKSEQVVIIRGSQLLQLLSQNQETKNLEIVLEVKLFSQIRLIKKYKDLGSTKYILLMTSDSGRLTVLEFNKNDENKYTYKAVLNEIYCKTGNRRESQGFYITTDLKGRAIFMAAIEKKKILFLTKRQNIDGQFEISSPLEANVKNQICYDLESLDVEYENPLFVAIELNYGDDTQPKSTIFTGEKKYYLMYYEVDLSLNTIIKKKQIFLEKQFDKILPLKKRDKLQNLFLLVSDQSIKFYSELGIVQDTIDIPQRLESQYSQIEQPVFINYEYFYNKGYEFYLIQNSFGDIFKLLLNENNKIVIEYLFTYKISSSFKILKSGVIFFANQNTDHELFQIQNLNMKFDIENNYYKARSIKEFKDLIEIQSLENVGGLIEMKYNDLVGDNVGQFYCITAGVNGGSLQVLKQGSKFEVLAQTKLPVKAEQLWSLGAINKNINDLTQYVILSHQDKLYTLQVDEKISECKQNLGFIENVKTLNIFPLIIQDIIQAYCQITEKKIRIIQHKDQYQDFDFAESVPILLSKKLNQKLILITQNNDIIYLIQNQLSYNELNRTRTESQPVTIEIYEPNLKRTSSSFLIVGFQDNSLVVYSLENQNDKTNSLMQISVQILNTIPKQICILDEQIYVSLQNGYLQQTYFDPTTGLLQNGLTSQIQEDQELKLFKIQSQGFKGAIIQSLSAIILEKEKDIYYYKHLNLDNNDNILCIDNLNTNMGDNCFIYMTENQYLKISNLQNNKTTTKKKLLEINPKKLLINQEDLLLYVMMSENRKFNKENKQKNIEKLKDKLGQDFDDLNQELIQLESTDINWISKVAVYKPRTLEQISTIDFESQNNQRLVSMNFCNFKEIENQTFFGLSIAEDFSYSQNKYSQAYFNLYTIDQKTNKFSLFHQTQLEFVSYSFCSFQGKLLLSQGGFLGLYSLGQKQILKKCEFKKKYNIITNIKVANDRIFITDVYDSVHMIKYNKKENSFVEIADTVLPCYTTALEVMDFNTIAIADKFGNLTLNRIPQHAEQEYNEDFVNGQFLWDKGYLNGAPIKMLEIIRYYYVNLITSIQSANKSFRNQDVLLYTDIEGKIGQIIPFDEHNELDFFTHLEMVLKECNQLFPTERNHKLFRSYYGAQKGIRDGELYKKQRKKITQKLELQQEDIMNWLQKFNLKSL